MKKANLNGKKLSLKKLQLSKITNLEKIHGGKLITTLVEIGGGENDCMFPENASKIKDGPIGSTGQ